MHKTKTISIKERPIIFSGEMVKAIREGRKTMTRRIVKPQPVGEWNPIVETYHPTKIDRDGNEYPGKAVFGAADEEQGRVCPYGKPGDRLWVRESHWMDRRDHTLIVYDLDHVVETRSKFMPERGRVHDDIDRLSKNPFWKHQPGMFLPRWASRFLLAVESVRVERLQEISEDDARSEGVADADEFRELWNKLNGKRSFGWDTNPWVWVIGFSIVENEELNVDREKSACDF